MPTGISGSPTTFTALITGTSTGGGGPLAISFDDTVQTFYYSNAYGTGSFDFFVVNDPTANKNNSTTLYGAIRNASFTATQTSPPTTSVPEPTSLWLLGPGVAAFLLHRRRRR
jgi:hypothetical protein